MGTGRRRSIEIPGVSHSAPIPMGARVDNIVFSSGISGADPGTGQVPDDGREQVRLAFANLRSFLDAAAVTAGDVVHVTVYLTSNDLRSAINEEWVAMFPEPDSRPARHTHVQQLRGGMQAQLEVVAVAAG
jgi:2-iminobutanoate/2-iminopropanoate deaminase